MFPTLMNVAIVQTTHSALGPGGDGSEVESGACGGRRAGPSLPVLPGPFPDMTSGEKPGFGSPAGNFVLSRGRPDKRASS